MRPFFMSMDGLYVARGQDVRSDDLHTIIYTH